MVKWKGGQLSEPWRYLCIHDNPGSGAHPDQTTELMLEEKKKRDHKRQFRKRSTRKRRPKHKAPNSRKRSTLNSKTKHPNLENEAPKTRKRSTQNSKTKHPKLKNEAPKSRNHCRLKDYNFKSCMTQAKPGGGNGCVKALKWPRTVVPSSVHESAKV